MIEWMASSSILILLILGIRALLRGRIKLWLQYTLWLLVAVRLLVPFSVMNSTYSIHNLLPEGTKLRSQMTTRNTGNNAGADEKVSTNVQMSGEILGNAEESIPDIYQESVNQNISQNILRKNNVNQSNVNQNQNTMNQEQQPDVSIQNTKNRDRMIRERIVYALLDIWTAGMIVMALVFLLTNGMYIGRIRKNRVSYSYSDSKIPVYLSDLVSTPCIYGVLKPAIYLPKNIERQSEVLSYVICHENVHYVHKDHLWSMLRVVCLIIHWYNPLVWIAAKLSKDDAELACDEGVLKRLGESEGISYGKTLIDLSVCRENKEHWMNLAASMSGEKKNLKNRLIFISKQPKMAIGTIILLQLLITVVLIITFTGKKASNESYVADDEVLSVIKQEEKVENRTTGDSVVLSATISEDMVNIQKEATGISGYYDYTGYLDECYDWYGFYDFVEQDYDMDGTIDRVYREDSNDQENPYNRVIYNYRIEFGNGDFIRIENMWVGLPNVQGCDLTGDGKNEIVFTLSYNFSANPMSYGELVIFEKKQNGYEKMPLPAELYQQVNNGENSKESLLEYAPCINLHYEQSGDRELELTSKELGVENEFRVTVPVSEELWNLGYNSYAGETSEHYIYDTVIQSVDSQTTYLDLHFGVFDKNSADEIVTTVQYEDGKLQLKESRYIQHYVETVPIFLEEGKNYELQLYGEEELGSGIYHIEQLEVCYVHNNKRELIQTINFETDSGMYWNDTSYELESYDKKGGIIVEDFNFDGYDDFAIQGWITAGSNIPYYCYLWNKGSSYYRNEGRFTNVGVDKESKLLVSGGNDGGGQYSTAYYGADEHGNLEFKRMVIEDYSSGEPETLDLNYVEDLYSVPAYNLLDIRIDDGITAGVIVYQAKEALKELYEWSGTKVDTCYFTVTDFGTFYFGLTEDDIRKSRTFFSRTYGEEAGFIECIKNISLTSARRLWYSPVHLHHYPDNYSSMTREEIVTWYFERAAIANNETMLTIEEVFEDDFIIQTNQGHYYEIFFDSVIHEVSDIYGPYQGYPEH